MGWTARSGLHDIPVTYFSAEYSRYENDKGVLSDIRLISEKKPRYFDRDFSITAAQTSINPIYEFRESHEKVASETRLLLTKTEVINVANRNTLVIYKKFTYEAFEQARTLLSAPSASACPEHASFGPQDSQGRNALGEKILGIASSIK